MRIKLAIGGIASVLCMAACSGEPHSSPATGGTGGTAAHGGTSTLGSNTEVDDFPRVYADGLCQMLVRCYATAALAILPDCQTFFERRIREQTFPHVSSAIADGRVEYHGAAVAECIQEVSSASCDAELLPDCSRVFVGTKETGEACTLDLECLDQACVVDGACPGVCAPRAALGAACTSENGCEPTLDCQTDSDGNGTCVKTAAEGESCSQTVPCRGYTFCSGLDAKLPEDTGTCVERDRIRTAKLDEPCDFIGEPRCEPDLVCTLRVQDGISVGSCQPHVPSGGACTYSWPDACPDAEYCHVTSDVGVKPATGSCRPKPGEGEECRYGTYNIAPCGAEQFCDLQTKLCTQLKHLDAACSHGDECYSNGCSADGKCSALLECEKSAEP